MSATTAATATAPAPAALRRAARRERRVVAGLAVLVAAVAAASLSLGGYPMSPPAVVRALAGAGSGIEDFVVNDVRLPRLVLALLVGAALALAGALLQALLDNPLASPDIVGITGGASVGAVWAIMVAGLGSAGVVGASLAGATVTALAIHMLAWRDGIAGQRFVLIGVGVAFMAHGALGYMLTRGDVRDAQVALAWLVGSVGSARWHEITVLAGALAVLVPAGLACGGALRALQLGDDGARALGLPADRARVAVIGVSVALVAAATAFAGPVAFVGFLGAPIARRLVGGARPALAPAAMVGALIVAGADLVGRHLLPGDVQMPVGVVTGVIGAPVLLWLLARGGRGAAR